MLSQTGDSDPENDCETARPISVFKIFNQTAEWRNYTNEAHVSLLLAEEKFNSKSLHGAPVLEYKGKTKSQRVSKVIVSAGDELKINDLVPFFVTVKLTTIQIVSSVEHDTEMV